MGLIKTLAILGLLITGYLTYVHYTDIDALCLTGTEDTCNAVLQSSYSEVLGIPVALLGVLTYLAILYLLKNGKKEQIAYISIVGIIAAGYFNWVMYSKLNAFCIWCEAHHMIMITLFFATTPWTLKASISAFIATLLLGGVTAGLVNLPVETGLGTCLAEKGYTFYGASWCPHCNEQKDLIGPSVDAIYIECARAGGQTEYCEKQGIEAYPTWEYPNGTRVTGTIPIEKLKELSGC